MNAHDDFEGIAIIGMSGRFPRARNLDEFWQNLASGVECISSFSEEELLAAGEDPVLLRDPNYVKAGSFIEDIDRFDASFFGISPREAEVMDPQHRLFLEFAWKALEDAGYNPETFESQIGVFAGCSLSTYMLYNLKGQTEHVGSMQTVLGNDKDYLCTRISYKLNLKGPSVTVQTACSTSLAAVCLACDSLLDHQCSMALAGGVTIKVPQKRGYLYEEGSILSPDGHCRAFDARAQGTVFGNGVGVVVLKRVREAIEDGDRIHAVVRGTALNNDGALKVGYTAPSVAGQAKVVAMAHALAETPPETITYIETHGTGTALGDPIEIDALTKVFRASTEAKDFCALGSVKTNIGHLESAAGVAGLIKTVLALKHKMLPPSLHYEQPNPEIDFDDTPFFVNRTLCQWKTDGSPRRAGVNSFGMGGTNAHVVLEEAPASPAPTGQPERPRQMLTLSAKSQKALTEMVERFEDFLAQPADVTLPDICFTANVGRAHFAHRLAVTSQSTSQLREQLSAFNTGGEIPDLVTGRAPERNLSGIVFLFTGQGSQYPGMGRSLYETHPTFRRVLDRCDGILRPHLEKPLLSVLFPKPGLNDRLVEETAYTQPALFALEYALVELWKSWGIEPAAVMGHSVGEYVAACVAGVFSLEDGLRLIAERGRLMQTMSGDGEMATVFAGEAETRSAIQSGEHLVSIAAVNGPKNTVISGQRQAIAWAMESLKARGVKTKRVNVSHAFHSSLMEPMLSDFELAARQVTFAAPRIGLISNLTGQPAGDDITSPEYWRRQVRQPVRFAEGIEYLHQQGYRLFVEIGPKPILSRLGSQCLPEAIAGSDAQLWLPSLDQKEEDWQRMLRSLATLYVKGANIDWAGFDRDHPRRRATLPGYPFQRQRYWIEPQAATEGASRSSSIRGTHVNPLLGERLHLAGSEEIHFQAHIRQHWPAFLEHHRVFQAAVLPATGYLEMALAAGADVFQSQNLMLEDVVLGRAMVLPEDQGTTIQLVLAADGSGAKSFRVFSLAANGRNGSPRWTLHASGRISVPPQGDRLTEIDLAAVRSRCNEEVVMEDFYRQFQQRGIDYGSSFRAIEGLWRGERESLGKIQLPQSLAGDADEYTMHPVVLDACFQAVAILFSQTASENTYLPVGLKRLTVYRRPGVQLWSHAQRRQAENGDEQALSAQLRLFSPEGQLIAEAEGLESRRARPEVILGSAQEPPENWLYQVQWRPQAAEHHSEPSSDPGRWLILADRQGVGQQLAAMLQKQGQDCQLVRSANGPGPSVSQAIEVNPRDPVDCRRLLESVSLRNWPLRGIVYLWSLDAAEAEAETVAALPATVQEICGAALHLVQAIAGAELTEPPLLCLVTRGAQPVGKQSVSGLAQSPLCGLGKAIALEHPELRCLRVDLDSAGYEGEVETLLQEILSRDGEDEVAFRHRVRYVPRLMRWGQTGDTDEDDRLEVPVDQPFSVEVSAPGGLENLRLLPMKRRPPGPGEIEIEVCAAGLNFKDVLSALGIYPGDPGPIGGECAGKVVAVGPGVNHFAIGDEVLAMALGSFASHVTVNASIPVHKPAGLSFEQAASIPVAFLTAIYSLQELAKISAGDRVLIHAAAGGVGTAAIQLAQQAGAEVLATASPGKWEFLRSLGIKQIMNSRTVDFADEVMSLTDGQGVDILLNSLSGEFIPKSLSALSDKGRFIEIGKRGIWNPEQVAQLKPEASYHIVDLGEAAEQDPLLMKSLLLEIVRQFDTGELKPSPLTTFPIEQAITGFHTMQQAKHIGKIVISLLDIPQQPSSQAFTGFHEDCAYLITGGLGGLGLLVARWMAARGAQHLVLVGRRGPRPADQNQLRRLEETGAQVHVMQADIAEQDQVAGILTEIEQTLPPLRGIIHAAAVFDDGILQNLSWEHFERVMSPKVAGAWNLHTQTRDYGLDFFILFSSIASLLGSPGQANYVAANAFLDDLAHYRRSRGLPALSINWGGWAEVGAAARRQTEERWQPHQLIAPQQGLELLEQFFRLPSPQIGVIPFNWSAYLQQFPAESEPPLLSLLAHGARQQGKDAKQSELLRWQVSAASPDQRREVVVAYLRDLVSRFLRLDPRQTLEPQQSLSQLGLDSLMGIQLKNRIRTDLGVEAPIERFIEQTTIAQLATQLLDQWLQQHGQMDASASAPGLAPCSRDGDLPLSFAQQRMWYLNQLDPKNPFYNLLLSIHLRGRLDVATLERAFNEIIRRHEALRTIFASVDGRPVQRIRRDVWLALRTIDLRNLPDLQAREEAERLAVAESLHAFDLTAGPLLRPILLRVGQQEHVMILSMHHIIMDGWSADVLLKELAVLYEAFSGGKPSPLPELEIQYADFAVWQRQWLQGRVLEAQRQYWSQRLGGDLPALALPVDRPRPAVQTTEGGAATLSLCKTLTASLAELSKREGVTLFMTLLAAFKTLLHRYAGQTDILVGTFTANRIRTEIEGLIGFFANTLVLRTDLSGNPTFRELLRRVRDVTQGAAAHQGYPFEKLVEELQPERKLNRNPLLQVAFVLQKSAPLPGLELPGLTLSHSWNLNIGTVRYDLEVHLLEIPDGITGSLLYRKDLFEAATITRMAGHYRTLLEEIVANPLQRISDIAFMTDAERRQLLAMSSETRVDPAGEPPAPQLENLSDEEVAAWLSAMLPAGEDEDQ